MKMLTMKMLDVMDVIFAFAFGRFGQVEIVISHGSNRNLIHAA